MGDAGPPTSTARASVAATKPVAAPATNNLFDLLDDTPVAASAVMPASQCMWARSHTHTLFVHADTNGTSGGLDDLFGGVPAATSNGGIAPVTVSVDDIHLSFALTSSTGDTAVYTLTAHNTQMHQLDTFVFQAAVTKVVSCTRWKHSNM
jgi:hypothetical protein